MKNIFKFSLLALFLGFVSCDDATDIRQESELDEEVAYQTVDDLQSGLNGVYAAYGPDFGGNGAGDIILFNALFTDNIKRGINSSGQGNQEYNFILQPGTDFPNRLWSNRYATINFSNRLLRAWERVAAGLTDENEIVRANHIKGQAIAMRALCHFDLLQYFSPNYQDDDAPGVIIMDFVPNVTENYQRSSTGEVFEFIKADLDEAAGLLAGFTNPPYYINGDVVQAIRTRVALCEGDYETARTLSTDLATRFAPVEPEQYFAMFIDDATSDEEIFTLARVQGDNGVVSLFYANESTISGSPFFELSNSLFNAIPSGDIRRQVLVEPTSDINANILLIGKYRGNAADQQINDIKLIRGSEMYLIMVETMARAGMLNEAEQAMLAFRQTRNLSGTVFAPNYNTTDEALVDVLAERRIELAFEGHRYLDLKRLGAELGIGIDRDDADCASFSAPCSLPAGDYRFTLPIPRNEVRANPSIEQNPQY
ncbi:RagB/SusD family nutrient uptake outer membrane protein [Flavobacterium sp.]|uniref:RagB/SusD family nutrient uptake outer membrane protein n=1 Tax=Flavobacterium sp. TaxID=239 RepID=UPI0026370800|nr:RagB/SusD family nutrient uptake outer membrane protein [Flavobacterium sp.]